MNYKCKYRKAQIVAVRNSSPKKKFINKKLKNKNNSLTLKNF